MPAQDSTYPRSEAMRKALGNLMEHNGEGVIDKYGKLCAGGVQLRVEPVTWLRLITLGDIECPSPMRLRITLSGRQAAKPKTRR